MHPTASLVAPRLRVRHARRDLAFVTTVLFLLSIIGCGPVRLVSPYDAILDQGTMDVHAKITTFVLRMEASAGKAEGTYDANQGFYSDIRGSIASLRLRAAATPKNEITVKQLDELIHNVENLQKLHQIGAANGVSKAAGDPALSAIDTNCNAIVTFEMAKRRGDGS
jgi:hypothetical protein